MKELNEKDKISLYGNLIIKSLSKKTEENICIAIENKEISKIGETLYDFLWKQYEKYDCDWKDISKKVKTTKIAIDEETINSNCYISIYGYVEDWRGLPSEKGKRYNFFIPKITIQKLFRELESTYDDYICDFDTTKDGLKFRIEKIEIYD